MGDNHTIDMNQMMKSLSGGILRLALDDELTIIYASEVFYKLIDVDINNQAVLPKTIVKTVYSADMIMYTHQIVAQKKRKDNQLALFYRVLLKSGDLRWILINGSKTEESYNENNKEYPIYFCMAIDITDHMVKYKQLEQKVEYYDIMSEMSKELTFEYVIATDSLVFSKTFRETFGIDPKVENFSKKLEKTGIIHPEDLPGIVKVYRSVMNGKKQVRCEFRIITKDGQVLWYVCHASIVFDENKNPFKVLGKLSAMCMRREEDSPAIKIKLDTLTQVYSKDTSDKMIRDHMLNQDSSAISALFICELGNYKNINDIVKVVDGENVLVSIAKILKRSFRRTDIIGRTGLSEFTVCMRDITSDKYVYRKAQEICKEVNDLYSYSFNKSQLSISIGITFARGSLDYSTAVDNAKTALLVAKKESSSSFEAFNPPSSK